MGPEGILRSSFPQYRDGRVPCSPLLTNVYLKRCGKLKGLSRDAACNGEA